MTFGSEILEVILIHDATQNIRHLITVFGTLGNSIKKLYLS